MNRRTKEKHFIAHMSDAIKDRCVLIACWCGWLYMVDKKIVESYIASKHTSHSLIRIQWGNAIKLLGSRPILASLLSVQLFVIILLVYSILRDAEISLSRNWRVGWLRINPKENQRIMELEKQLANSVDIARHNKLQQQHYRLEEEYRRLRSEYSNIAKIVNADNHDADAMAQKITLLAARSKQLERDVRLSVSVVRSEVFRGRSINTNRPSIDEKTRELYAHIQKLLCLLGVYNGEIDGDQATTCYAVRKFQREYGLKDDGIIGHRTFDTMERAFEEAKSH